MVILYIILPFIKHVLMGFILNKVNFFLMVAYYTYASIQYIQLFIYSELEKEKLKSLLEKYNKKD